MDFKKYLAESELKARQPVTGDSFDITINEFFNIETSVLEHTDGSVTLMADKKMMEILESCGMFSDSINESQDKLYRDGRDFKVVKGTEYKGFVMGDESYEDGEGFVKRVYGVFYPVMGGDYHFVSPLFDPKTGKEPSPYGGIDYKVLYQKTVDAITKQDVKESASAGGTSSGSIATAPAGIGKPKRRQTDEVLPAIAAGAASAVGTLARGAGAAVRAASGIASMMGDDDELDEAEYQGREVTLNKPTKGDVKKYKVYVKDPDTGNVKKVNFGDPNMEIKRDDPKRRKSFRARHNCASKKDKTTAGYWSCKMWSKTPVSKLV